MNPILRYIKNLVIREKLVGNSTEINGMLKADKILSALIDEGKVPGISIMVNKNGETIFSKGYGYADINKKESVVPSKTVFRIASVSKPIAATALAHMVSEKKIDLDKSFYHYVPYYPKKKWDFTIRQLASHTAGIRGYKGMEYGLNKSYSIKEGISVFKDDDLVFEPGTDYLYNSFDWILVSLAIQEVSGMPFEKYVDEKVLKPLNMKNTFPETINQEGSIAQNLSAFYSRNKLGFKEAIPVNNFYKLAGGGYLSTAEDVIKLGQAYLDKSILNENALKPFFTTENIKSVPTYYGLGWQVSQDKKGRQYYGHVGNGVGGYSNFFVYPEENMVCVILTNCTNPDVQIQLDEVVSCFIDFT